MNGSVNDAQKHTGQVTAKQLRAVVRAFRGERSIGGRSGLFMHGRAVFDRPSYSDAFVFAVRRVKREERTETEAMIEVPGWVSTGHTSKREEVSFETSRYMKYSESYRPRTGFWSLDYCETLDAVLDLLPSDATVAFHVYLDAGSNGYLIAADAKMQFGTEQGLHTDMLYLVARFERRGKPVELRFLLDTNTGAHNSARFGSPKHDGDTEGRGP